MTGVFVDTNVLVYARDASQTQKQSRAHEWLERLWRDRAGRISFQVLSEYYSVSTQRLSPGLDKAVARADVRRLLLWEPILVDKDVLEGAWGYQDRFGCSWWDALILAAAKASGCGWVLTEDLQDGMRFGSLEVVNPFRHTPTELLD